MAEDKDSNNGSPPPSDTEKEKKSDEENVECMLKIGPFPVPMSKDELETLIEDNCNAEIRKGIENTIALVNDKETTALVTFKTAELARQAKSLLDKLFDVYIGRFDHTTGLRLNLDGTPLFMNPSTSTPESSGRTRQRTCYTCNQPGHKSTYCPMNTNNMLNKTASSTGDKDSRNGSPPPSDTEIEKNSDEESVEWMLKINSFPVPLSKDKIEKLIKDNLNAEIIKDIEKIALVKRKTKTTALVTFKKAELARRAKSLLDKLYKVYIGRFDRTTGMRVNLNGTSMFKNQSTPKPDSSGRTRQKTCYICNQPGHISHCCPMNTNSMLNETASSTGDKDSRNGSPPPSDTEIEKKSGEESVEWMLKIGPFPVPMSKDELEKLIEDNLNAETIKGIGNIIAIVNAKNRTTALVTFKAVELARRAKSLLGKVYKVYIGRFDYTTGMRVNLDGTPLFMNPSTSTTDSSGRTRQKTCYTCNQPDHISFYCPMNTNTMLNETASSIKATKRHASDDALAPVKAKVSKIENDEIPDNRVLRLINIPLTWTRSQIEDYIKEHTKDNEEIFKGLLFVYLDKASVNNGVSKPSKYFIGKCHVLFASTALCTEAKHMINNVITTPTTKKIWATYQNKKWPVIWLPNNKPDIKAMQAREQLRKQEKFASTNVNKFGRNQPNLRTWQEQQQNYNSDSYPTQKQSNKFSDVYQNLVNKMNVVKADKDNSERYGLSPAFLESIGVTLPITSKIFVDNLSNEYDDEKMICKLFSHAGSVASVKVIARVNDILKVIVQFDHPVEAIQAISMFHNQECFGKNMKVFMDRKYFFDRNILPVGLKAFGPGLGKDGLPLKNVRNSIELQNGMNMIMNEIAALKISFENNQRTDENKANNSSNVYSENSLQPQSNTSTSVHNNMQNALATLGSSLTNPVANNSLLALSALLNPQVSQELQLLTQQSAGNTLLTGLNTLQTQLNPQPQASTGWNVTQSANGPNTLGYNYNHPVSTNMQDVPNTQGYNMQATPHLQGVQNVQTQNMQAYNTQSSVPNMQAYNTQSSLPNMQGQNMQAYNTQSSVPNMQGQNMQAYNTQSSLPYMQGQNMQAYNTQSSVPNMQGQNMQAYNTQSSLPKVPDTLGFQNVQSKQGFQNVQSKTNMQAGPNVQGIKGDTDKTSTCDNCIVTFNYLPPSVTPAALQSKMSEIGKVHSAVLTGPGRALVSFYSPRDADACISLFHRTKVDGQVIEVKKL